MAVPGRVRLRVEGLRGEPDFAAQLKAKISAAATIRHVSASAITGNVLILFDARSVELRRLLDEVAQRVSAARNGAGSAARRGTHEAIRDCAKGATHGSGSVWHMLGTTAALERLDTDLARGLDTAEAERRLATVGLNQVPAPRPKSALAILGRHLRSVPILLLGGAVVLSLASGAVVDAMVILAVVAVNATVGYFTEHRVERILMTLQDTVVPHAFVRRDGRAVMVPAAALVPGDVMILETGHEVPADGRVVEAVGLATDESALTGESLPIKKTPALVDARDIALGDRVNMVFSGTSVAEGSGIAVAVATGRNTEIGRVRALVAETETPPTPLERQLDRMGRHLVLLAAGCCGATLVLGVLRGVPPLEMLRTVVSLAVAAVPESLPAVATTTLALGMQRMMRQNILVRRLAAVEGLGGTTVICVDKTGTLTENHMSVHGWYLGGREYLARHPAGPGRAAEPGQLLARALGIGVLCNEADLSADSPAMRGSSTEAALLRAASDAGLDYRLLREQFALIAVRPRIDGENWMGTVHEDRQGRRLVAVKGAPEEVIGLATHWLDGETVTPLTSAAREEILAVNARVAADGMRVLGLAFKEVDDNRPTTYDGLTWVGLVALKDPVRPGVRDAIGACRRAGIRPVILTGDQAHTAAAIGRELGLVANGRPRVLEASALIGVDPTRLRDLVSETDIFARVSPAHKCEIVRAFQASGHVVAMTGDGFNDAAALRAADIGIAMGARGTDVARDVADMVLIDDDFASIVKAVEQGRTIRANIERTLKFLLATNASEILVTLGALTFGIARPMSAIQFLWMNLLSDVFPALALAVEPPELDVMARPPRNPAEPILSPSALREIGRDAAVLTAGTLSAHGLALARYGVGPQSTTVALTTLTSAQLFHALGCRSRGRSRVAALREDPLLLGVVGGSLALQLATVMVPPLRRLLGTTLLSPSDWALVAGGAMLPLAVGELERARGASAALPA